MDMKYIEIRDRGTFIPALALRFTGAEHYLLRRAGYGEAKPYVLLINLVKQECQYDPYSWSNGMARTMPVAHQWLIEHWDEHVDGGVLNVEFVLNERDTPKVSEAVSVGG